MPISIQPPKPGDLITSNFVKQLIEQLQFLDARLTHLEAMTPGSSGAVMADVITSGLAPGYSVVTWMVG